VSLVKRPTVPARRGRWIALGGVLVVAVVVAVLAVRAANQPPSVTFSSVAGTLHTGPAQYCDVRVTDCDDHPDAVVSMPVPAGQPLKVSVPDGISTTPWQVAFVYKGPDGAPVQARSPVFPPKQAAGYTLTLPDPADQLLTAQVQQYGGGQPQRGPDGEPSFPIRGTWVLRVP
jgi:hypothetical protein